MRKFTVVLLVGFLLFFSAGELYASWIPFNRTQARRERDYQTAIGLLEQEEYRLARMQFNNCLASYSDTSFRARVFYGLGEIDYIEEKYAGGLENYIRALEKEKLDQTKTNYALERALEAALKTDNVDSGNFLLAYIDRRDRPYEFINSEVMDRVVEFLQTTGRSDEAFERARAYHRANPEDIDWTYELALFNLDREKPRPAIELLEKITFDTSPRRADATFLSAEIYYQIEEFDRAREKYELIMDEPGFEDRSLYGLAWLDIESGELKAGAEKLKPVASDTDSDLQFEAARDLGRLNRVGDEENEALRWYERALELAEGRAKSKLNLELGDYLVEQDRFEEAMARYEASRDLGPEAQRHLIDWYLTRDRYDSALEQLGQLRASGEFETESDSYQLSFTLYNLSRFEEADRLLPSPQTVADSELRFKVYRLRGAINFELEEFKKARTVYQKWQDCCPGPEPLYNLALVELRVGDTDRAMEYFESVLELSPEEPWNSRALFQLARSAYYSGETDKYRAYDDRLDSGHLTSYLRAQRELIKLDRALQNETYDSALRERLTGFLPRANRNGLKRQWVELLLDYPLVEEWWREEFLPVMRADTELINLGGYRAADHFSGRGQPELAIEVADQFLKLELSPAARRALTVALLRCLYEEGHLEAMGRYIPPQSDWENWPPEQAYELGLHLVRYHRSRKDYRQGFEQLKRLKQEVDFSGSDLNKVNEWLASLEVSLQRYKSAYERLQEINKEDLTNSGRLNLAVAAYYTGDVSGSGDLFAELEEEWKRPPLEFFEAGFRIYRELKADSGIQRLSEQLFERASFSDDDILDLQIDNFSYWNVEEKYERGLLLAGRLLKLRVDDERKLPVYYYRSVFKYNNDQLREAREQLKEIYENYDPDTEWLSRLVELEIETNLRLEDWPQAYRAWQKLPRVRRGEAGRRLLVGQGVEQEPEKFKSLLTTLREEYPKYLTASEENYWQARLEEVAEKPEEAIARYQAYLQSEDPRRRESARNRLAELNIELGKHREAADQYRELLEETGEPVYRVYLARQLHQLQQYRQAIRQLEVSLEELPDRQGWVRYQLGIVYHESGRPAEAFENYSAAVEREEEDPGRWYEQARYAAAEVGLNLDRTAEVKELVSAMPAGDRRLLYEIELLRREGETGEAVSKLDDYRSRRSEEDRIDLFYTIAPAVYWTVSDYENFLKYSPERPESVSDQKKVMRALLALERIDGAEKLYHRLSSEAVADCARLLGEYYFEREQWRPALGYYNEAGTEPVVFYRKADIHYQRQDYQESFRVWEGFFNSLDKKSKQDILLPALGLFEETVLELENYNEGARLLKENWPRIPGERQT
ncbi:MAG: tetratricopeptide repeat protein, partial [bacterium]